MKTILHRSILLLQYTWHKELHDNPRNLNVQFDENLKSTGLTLQLELSNRAKSHMWYYLDDRNAML